MAWNRTLVAWNGKIVKIKRHYTNSITDKVELHDIYKEQKSSGHGNGHVTGSDTSISMGQ